MKRQSGLELRGPEQRNVEVSLDYDEGKGLKKRQGRLNLIYSSSIWWELISLVREHYLALHCRNHIKLIASCGRYHARTQLMALLKYLRGDKTINTVEWM